MFSSNIFLQIQERVVLSMPDNDFHEENEHRKQLLLFIVIIVCIMILIDQQAILSSNRELYIAEPKISALSVCCLVEFCWCARYLLSGTIYTVNAASTPI